MNSSEIVNHLTVNTINCRLEGVNRFDSEGLLKGVGRVVQLRMRLVRSPVLPPSSEQPTVPENTTPCREVMIGLSS
jgi:hypothetical protein